jgi:hypothetical protein
LLPSEVRDKARYGGNYLNLKENLKPGFSPFYVFVSGHIESGQINEHDGICCKYDFVAGTDWQIVEVSLQSIDMYRVTAVQFHNIATRVSRLIVEWCGTTPSSWLLGPQT